MGGNRDDDITGWVASEEGYQVERAELCGHVNILPSKKNTVALLTRTVQIEVKRRYRVRARTLPEGKLWCEL